MIKICLNTIWIQSRRTAWSTKKHRPKKCIYFKNNSDLKLSILINGQWASLDRIVPFGTGLKEHQMRSSFVRAKVTSKSVKNSSKQEIKTHSDEQWQSNRNHSLQIVSRTFLETQRFQLENKNTQQKISSLFVFGKKSLALIESKPQLFQRSTCTIEKENGV